MHHSITVTFNLTLCVSNWCLRVLEMTWRCGYVLKRVGQNLLQTRSPLESLQNSVNYWLHNFYARASFPSLKRCAMQNRVRSSTTLDAWATVQFSVKLLGAWFLRSSDTSFARADKSNSEIFKIVFEVQTWYSKFQNSCFWYKNMEKHCTTWKHFQFESDYSKSCQILKPKT